ncbi:MFS transporter [Fusobacterium sp.]|uniref:MFS transporter n=1 Tax=Fusobacterium sp. TaxID=68766 RepID=UPI00290384C5|nr:MFS transporter [Fusobacterium sp.]MDU1910108.1 MFS transporter [Fusobacterium sp.]
MENKTIHMSELSLFKRITAYLVILIGYFFYCYNFSVIDYVRPFLVEFYGMTLNQTALFYTAQSLGALIGAFTCAWFAENFGRKKPLIIITLLNGVGTLINMGTASFPIWMIMRFIIGISLGGYFTVAVSIMVGLFTGKVRAKVAAIASSTFSIALMVMGTYAAFLGEKHWEMILAAGGIAPVVSAILMIFFVPDEKKVIPFGKEENNNSETIREIKKGTWGEMFSSKYIRFTISCMLLSGLNFIGYQFFSGFVTVYLREVRLFDATTMGFIFTATSTGSWLGAYFWGTFADKFGRKFAGVGFILSSLMICCYFIAPTNARILSLFGFLYGLGLSSSAIWGGYFTELFPDHLRSMGASLFHAGRIIALFAPSIVVWVRSISNLQTAMWGAPIIFTIAGFIWLSLPETLTSKLKK